MQGDRHAAKSVTGFRSRTWWSVIRGRSASWSRARTNGDQRCIWRFGGFDKTIVAPHPIVFQPSERWRDGLAILAAVILEGIAVAPFGVRFARRNGAGAAAIRHVTSGRRQIAAVRVMVT